MEVSSLVKFSECVFNFIQFMYKVLTLRRRAKMEAVSKTGQFK